MARKELTREKIIELLNEPLLFDIEGSEKVLEDNVYENIDLICEGLGLPPIVTIGRQKLINAGGFYIKPDLMVRHIDGTMTVFEVKKRNDKHPCTATSNQMEAIGQLLLYGNVLETIIENKVRLALIDNKIYYRTYCAFCGYKLPITLIDFQKDRVFVPYNGWGCL